MAGAGIFIGVAGIVLLFGFVAIPLILFILLQVFLCRRSLKLGLILPAMSFAMSLLMVLSVVSFGGVGGASGGSLMLEENGVTVQETVTKNGTVTVYDGAGNIIDQYPDPNYDPEEVQADTIRSATAIAAIFLVGNIPTAIFGGIWLHSKGRRDTRDDLERMRIEDLG